jgi:catechol 2,3-dioxygenase-like lactoylglutathione lyase family enzyme
MSLAHFTLATSRVEETATFFEETFGFGRRPLPANSPVDVQWLDIGGGQEMHVLFVEGFQISPFEAEFGRHVALYYPPAEFPALQNRLTARGAELIAPLRATPFERFFFREPINGYVFEVIEDADRADYAEGG